MMDEYGSDKDAHPDLTRVLRVPGFYHQKAEPYLINLVGTLGRLYSRAELLQCFLALS